VMSVVELSLDTTVVTECYYAAGLDKEDKRPHELEEVHGKQRYGQNCPACVTCADDPDRLCPSCTRPA
jgi:hypothetical protein